MNDPLPPSFTNPIEAFEAHLTNVRLRSPRTVRSYVTVARELGRAVDGAVLATDVATLTAFLGRGNSRSVRAGRVRWNLELSAVRALCQFAVDAGSRTDDPSATIGRQRVVPAETEPLTLDEMVRLVGAAQEHSPAPVRLRNIALLQTFLHTALRVAEVVALDAGQVDLQAHVIHGVHRKGGKIVSAPVNDVVAEALENFLPDRSRRHPGTAPRALFLSQQGDRLAVRTVQQLVSAYAKRAGITRRVTPHSLRHSAATALSALGTPMRVIQDICAHSSIVTTQRYVHTGSRDRQDAVDLLGRAFRAQQRSTGSSQPPP